MADDPKQALARNDILSSKATSVSFTDRALERLPEEKRDQLLTTAIEGRLELDRKREEALLAAEVGRDTMSRAVRHVEEMAAIGAGYEGEVGDKVGNSYYKAKIRLNHAQDHKLMVVAIIAVIAFALAVIFK